MSDEFRVQWSVSLPPAAQYAKGHMLNIRGETVEEVQDFFKEILESDFIEKATEVAALLVAGQVVSDGTKGETSAKSSKKTVPDDDKSDDQDNVTTMRRCEHGKREKRSGERKDGSIWVGYFCPEKKKKDQCEVEWEK